jgi:hypothetical protein
MHGSYRELTYSIRSAENKNNYSPSGKTGRRDITKSAPAHEVKGMGINSNLIKSRMRTRHIV